MLIKEADEATSKRPEVTVTSFSNIIPVSRPAGMERPVEARYCGHSRPRNRSHDEHGGRHGLRVPPARGRSHALLAARDLPQAVHIVIGNFFQMELLELLFIFFIPRNYT